MTLILSFCNYSPVKPPQFVYIDDDHYGYTRLTVTPTTLSLEYVRDMDGQVADSFSIPRKKMS